MILEKTLYAKELLQELCMLLFLKAWLKNNCQITVVAAVLNIILLLFQQLHSSVRTGNLETCLRLLSLGAQANFFHPVGTHFFIISLICNQFQLILFIDVIFQSSTQTCWLSRYFSFTSCRRKETPHCMLLLRQDRLCKQNYWQFMVLILAPRIPMGKLQLIMQGRSLWCP